MSDSVVWRADWTREQSVICGIRRRVFIEEQQVPEELEWDGLDTGAQHVLGGLTGAAPCATGRLLATGQIGRMAVLPGFRRLGIGGLILNELLQAAVDSGMARVFLHAQATALPFYRKHGFTTAGQPFIEAGIEHRLMQRGISRNGINSGHT